MDVGDDMGVAGGWMAVGEGDKGIFSSGWEGSLGRAYGSGVKVEIVGGRVSSTGKYAWGMQAARSRADSVIHTSCFFIFILKRKYQGDG
jgi:hypothetical protein